MRVVAHNGARIWGGAEKATALLLAGLQGRGHGVLLLCNDAEIARRAAAMGVPAEILPIRGDAFVNDAMRLARRLRALRADAFIIGTYKKLFLAAMGARLARVPRVVARVGLETDRPRSAKYRWAIPRWVHTVVVNASRIRPGFLALPGFDERRVVVIHNGVRTPERRSPTGAVRAALGIPASAFVVGAVGRLAEQKHLYRLLHAVAALPSGDAAASVESTRSTESASIGSTSSTDSISIRSTESASISTGSIDSTSSTESISTESTAMGSGSAESAPSGSIEVHCVLAGEGEERGRLEALAAELGIAARTHFLGFRDDTGDVLGALDAFVICSNREGMSNAMLEALAAGVPVVSTPVSGADEALAPFADGRRPGILVDGFDSAPIAGALRGMMADPRMRAGMAEAARERAREEFGMERMLDRWEGVLGAVGSQEAPR